MKKAYPRLNPNPTLSESDCMHDMPWIQWRKPETVSVFASFDDPSSGVVATGLMCRFCTAMYGIGGTQVRDLPQTRAEFDEHMQEHLDNLKSQAEHKGKS